MQKLFLTILSLCVLTGCTWGSQSDSFRASTKTQMLKATTTPYGKYPNKITYTIAHLTSSNNSNMPSGDTYENNAYTRYLLKKLNIQNIDTIEASGDQYFDNIDMSISSKDLPDIMIVNSNEDLQYLVKNNMIEDLSTAYKNCASSRIKAMYESYGSSILDNVTFNNKLYAMPETNIDDGPNLFWVRQDWLKKLHLSAPHTLSDVEKIVKAFITKDPGNNGKGKTTGLMVDTQLTAGTGYSSEYLLDLYFAAYNTYPMQWIKTNGKITYGSIDSSVKKALAHIKALYQAGIIDKNFLLRSDSNIVDAIEKGTCGSFFGPWWVPNNPLVEAVKSDSSAVWKPYLISTSSSGTTNYHTLSPSTKFVVVKKGFKHPEIIFKIISVIFDYLRYENKNVSSINKYYALNVDPTARPISINVDYNDALHRSYINIKKLLSNQKNITDLITLDTSYANACQSYLSGSSTNKAENWAAYASRIEALSLLESDKIKKIKSYYFGQTKTMQSEWWKLKNLENKSYLKIISGEEDLSYFDTFVKKWKAQGGSKITKEVQKEVNKQ